jgi:hypothetical protein
MLREEANSQGASEWWNYTLRLKWFLWPQRAKSTVGKQGITQKVPWFEMLLTYKKHMFCHLVITGEATAPL